jgi:hypothetical protein
MLATRSARELPMAKIVRPMMAFDKPKMKPRVYKESLINDYTGGVSFPTDLEDVDDLISDCHDPYDSHEETHDTSSETSRRVISVVAEEGDENSH